jgi:outer membrane protein TolC
LQPSASVKTIVIIILSLFAFSGTSSAQNLTFESAVQEMLAKNFDILIVSNNKEIADQLNNIGTAGFLPTVDAGLNYEKSFNNTQQIFFDGREQGADNAESSALTASVLLNWTLFDGFRMFATKNILEANETLSGYYLRAASEEAMLLLSNLYYQIVQRQKLLDVYKESLAISKERYELAVKRKEIGSASQQEVLQALIDMNADSTQVMREEAEIGNLKTELNLVLARDVAGAIETGDFIPLDTTLTLENMLASASAANVDLLIAREDIRVALNEVRVAKSFLYPEAGVYAGYDYGRLKNEVGVLQSNRGYGPSVGVFVNFNLFNGLRDYKNMKVSKIEIENARINSDKTTATNSAFVLQAYRDYDVAMRVMRLERESQEKANENVSIALKRFELGNISSVEFRDVQLQSVEAQSRLLAAQYAIRISELELKRLAGTLAL